MNAYLFFDGNCIFCQFWVRVFYRLDYQKKLRFVSLQSDYAKNILPSKYTQNLSTFVFLSNDHIYIKSTAIIYALSHSLPLLKIVHIFLLIPRPLRDSIYDLVARWRYKIFGTTDVCKVPTKMDQDRFIL